jgi:hypothetical protein
MKLIVALASFCDKRDPVAVAADVRMNTEEVVNFSELMLQTCGC